MSSQHLAYLYDADVDVLSSNARLAAIITDGEGRNITWFLMTSQRVALDRDCAGDAECLTWKVTDTGKVLFPWSGSLLIDGQTYFVCALVSPRPTGQGQTKITEVCGNGVTIDDTPPVAGTVDIQGTTQSGYLGNKDHVMVTWNVFSGGGDHGSQTAVSLLNYSVALGELVPCICLLSSLTLYQLICLRKFEENPIRVCGEYYCLTHRTRMISRRQTLHYEVVHVPQN